MVVGADGFVMCSFHTDAAYKYCNYIHGRYVCIHNPADMMPAWAED